MSIQVIWWFLKEEEREEKAHLAPRVPGQCTGTRCGRGAQEIVASARGTAA